MPTPTYDLISEQTLGSSSASVTFSSIPQTYKDLVLEITAAASSGTNVRVQFNGDTSSSNYSDTILTGTGSAASSLRLTNRANIALDYNGIVGTTFVHTSVCNIFSYTSTNVAKTCLTRSNNASAGVDAIVSLWRKTPEAITTILITNSGGNYITGSTFRLWGVAG